ncbi:MAG TPA: hypothetical protein VNH83_05785 [Bryobacteraceae bacterium]|nr:hypothetical protein [Bryobacteraceae bacterium]
MRMLFWVLVLAGVLCWAQLIPAFLTGGLNNGRAWEGLDEAQRIMYASGIGDGIRLGARGTEKCGYEAKAEKYDVGGFTVSDIVHEMTVLFTDRENIRIPIVEAYEYSLEKLKGKHTKAELEQIVIRMRQVAVKY